MATNPSTNQESRLRRLSYIVVSLAILLFDQVTKAIIAATIPLHSSISVIDGFFDLTHVKNRGAAFGLFATIESPMRTVLLNCVAFGVFFAVLAYALRSSAQWTRLQVGLALILGGALGNLVDRVRFGSVTDFLDFYVGSHRWPAFNVADSAITIGVCLLALDIWRKPQSEAPPSQRPAAA
jgi:signal peptidase II